LSHTIDRNITKVIQEKFDENLRAMIQDKAGATAQRLLDDYKRRRLYMGMTVSYTDVGSVMPEREAA
jgi:hypothetical protein